ncbi:MAG TPA: glycoside hydrolase family 15 protein [Acidimicrobiales bacterium]|nr:glycoside hydrolase family 15 protein [Acidimicrobiales bacterium]
MTQRIEDYALIGDTHTAALVGRDGSLDWLCVPRFDSAACFAALLGTPENGRWLLAPKDGGPATRRSYRGHTLVLDQEWDTPTGSVRITDFMPPRHHRPRVFRRVQGLRGAVEMIGELVIRFEYGSQIPWVTQTGSGVRAVAGPDEVEIDSPLQWSARAGHQQHELAFVIKEGDEVDFRLHWAPSYDDEVHEVECGPALDQTISFWVDWCGGLTEVHGEWEPLVRRSLLTLKSLTYAVTGGIVAAPTTSLPEALGGARNWDYRYCWIRDATLTLEGLGEAGAVDEARAWFHWLVRAAAGNPDQLQVMYGVAGERRLPELELDWLNGYESSLPVRVGNAASTQFQLDVFGELMEAVHLARSRGGDVTPVVWDLQKVLVKFVEDHWEQPDQGIWELRGPPQPLVYSRVMAWVAMDRAVKAVEKFGLEGPVERWREVRDTIHEQVLRQGYNAEVGSFTQAYGSTELDASLLLVPLMGFLPVNDPRIVGTIEAVQRELMVNGFVIRYRNTSGVDGLPGQEGTFLPCTLWLVSCLAALGRCDEAREMLLRVLSVANDVGLFSEEYDTERKRLVGNFPQAFTHVAFINAARSLANAAAQPD